jgi:hypothetical protein
MKFSKLLVIGLIAVLAVSSVSAWKEPLPGYIYFDLGPWDAYKHFKGFNAMDDNKVVQQCGRDLYDEWMCLSCSEHLTANVPVDRVKVWLKPFHANQSGKWFRKYDQDASRGIYVDYCNDICNSEIYVYYYDMAGNQRTFHTTPKTGAGDNKDESWDYT